MSAAVPTDDMVLRSDPTFYRWSDIKYHWWDLVLRAGRERTSVRSAIESNTGRWQSLSM